MACSLARPLARSLLDIRNSEADRCLRCPLSRRGERLLCRLMSENRRPVRHNGAAVAVAAAVADDDDDDDDQNSVKEVFSSPFCDVDTLLRRLSTSHYSPRARA